jgi:hypothetical protein
VHLGPFNSGGKAMYKLMLTLAIVPVLSFGGHAAESDLYGTYRLVSTVTEMADTGQIDTEAKESGFITYGSDGRMSVLIIRGDRPKPESLAK